uniref:Zinc finger protein 654 n=1 Tax=Iconisemion striatum TaxID=60296 RepID=A0A1A7WVZ6_9TELE
MADNESDLETDGLETALDTLCIRHCSKESSLNSKEYCSEFCELVEEYTGQWHVPLPQLKVLRTALCNFTKATAAFPDDCQHVQYVLSSLALSFFELMLFFSKEEFIEEPLKDILDTFQECHCKLLRHRNIYLQHVKQTIKGGGPWENPVLQGILKETDLPPNEVEDFLSSELPIFLELRVRYLQACERVQEVMALAKCCLENHETGKHLYFHQAYLTCLYKASLYENLQKEMAEIDGRDAVEIICNTESVEKDEFLLSLCRAFLTRQLHNGDMYYIWDLVFIWSRLYLRAHPSPQGFLAECLQLASSATNVRAIFPIIKLVTTELGAEGVQVCVELCARALQLVDVQADAVTQSLVCKTIAFLLPHDLEICRACALLVFCQERSLEAYRTVCLLYTHPDEEQHPHSNAVRTSVRFPLLQMLKERLCFDPEFWNLFTLRAYCLELMSDNVMKDAELTEIKEEEEYSEEPLPNNCIKEPCTLDVKSSHLTQTMSVSQDLAEKKTDDGAGGKCIAPNNSSLKKSKWKKRPRKRTPPLSDDERELNDDPEFRYNLKSASLGNKPVYSLRQNHSNTEKPAPKFSLNRKREYLSRCVKSQILKRKDRKKRWLQGLPKFEQVQTVKVKNIVIGGKKRGRKPLYKLELSYPDNVVYLTEESPEAKTEMEDKEQETPYKDIQSSNRSEQKENELQHPGDTSVGCASGQSEHTQEESRLRVEMLKEQQAAVPTAEANPDLDGPLLELVDNPVEEFHCYCLQSRRDENEQPQPPGSTASGVTNGEPEVPVAKAKTWRERVLRTQQYRNCTYSCKFCDKTYKGMNVMRHALAHLKMRKLKCIFCGKRFKLLHLAKKHVMEHIEEMCKQTPCEPCIKETPPANGIMGKVENESQSQDENLISVPRKEPKRKITISNLSREERIIKNIRILVKKTCIPQKKGPNPEMQIKKQVDFKDEQVVITNDLVMVKNTSLMATNGEEKNVPAGENGQGVDLTYQLCPSETCDKVFLKIGSTLTRHSLKCHINEDRVLEKTFVWSKHKCIFCTRLTQFFQQYKEHMMLHNSPLPLFCYHLECKQRFATQQELKDHVRTHDPLRLQCQYSNCDKLFPSFQTLYDHEWRHYIPVPLKEELDAGQSKAVEMSVEAPWKQRVKVEELWLQNKKSPRESPTPGIHIDGNKMEACGIQTPDCSTNLPEQDSCSVSHEPLMDKSTINGYEEIVPASHVDGKSPPSKNSGKQPRYLDPINIKDGEEISTLSEGVHKDMAEPHIIEHKTFKPEDPAYARFVKTPFVRPPPSTYLNESLLSMRKRRSADRTPPQKYIYHRFKKKIEAETKKQQVILDAEQKVRHRCDKCLAFFCTEVELQTHQALNTCSSLFGFDSDDES